MINIEKLDEYVSLVVIKTYCKAHDECDHCKLKFLCDCMPIEPHRLKMEYNPSESNSQEPKNKDVGKLTAQASMEQRTFTSIDEMINAGPKTKEKINTGGILCSLSDKKTDDNVVKQIQEGLSNVMQDKLSKELKMGFKK